TFPWIQEFLGVSQGQCKQAATPNFEAISKFMKTKRRKKGQVTSRFFNGASGAQYVEVSLPKVTKPMEEMNQDDYELKRISLGQATHEGDAHLFRESTTQLLVQNEEYKQTMEQLEEHVRTLTAYVQSFLEPNVVPPPPIETIPPINNFDPQLIKKSQGYTMQGRANDKWVERILEKGKALLLEVLSLFEFSLATTSKVKVTKEEIEKEKSHWDSVFPLVSEMSNLDSHSLVSKNVFTSISDKFYPIWSCTMSVRYDMINDGIS
ncbi:hypothetical protein KI387_041258, partial [Taxus chinensis]